jgi:hypothetical protein
MDACEGSVMGGEVSAFVRALLLLLDALSGLFVNSRRVRESAVLLVAAHRHQ